MRKKNGIQVLFSEDDLAFSLGLGGLRKDPHCDRCSFPWSPGYSFPPLKPQGRMGVGNTEETRHGTLQLPQQPYQPLFWQLFSQDGAELNSKTCPSHTSIWSQALTKLKGTTEQQTFSVHNLPVRSQGSLLLTLLILYSSHPQGLALSTCSVDTCNVLPASSCASPQWPHLTVTFKFPSGNNFNSYSEWLLCWLHFLTKHPHKCSLGKFAYTIEAGRLTLPFPGSFA